MDALAPKRGECCKFLMSVAIVESMRYFLDQLLKQGGPAISQWRIKGGARGAVAPPRTG